MTTAELHAICAVVGHPPWGELARAGAKWLRLSWEGGSATLDPRTGGLATGPEAAAAALVHEVPRRLAGAPVAPGAANDLATASIEQRIEKREAHRYWTCAGERHELKWGDDYLLAGADDWLLVSVRNGLGLLDAVAGCRRSVALPPLPVVGGPEVSGIPSFNRGPLIVDETVVLAAAPALLFVPLEALGEALRADRIEWSIETTLPLSDELANAPLRLSPGGGKVVIGRYTVAAPVGATTLSRAEGRLWLPFGYERIVAADGSVMPWHSRPVATASHRSEVGSAPLWCDRAPVPPVGVALATRWAAVRSGVAAPDATGLPDDLVSVAQPRNGEEALAYASAIELDAREGAYGPMSEASARIRALLCRDVDGEAQEDAISGFVMGAVWHQGSLFGGSAYAVVALVGVLSEPAFSCRKDLAESLAVVAASTQDKDDAVARAVRYAFGRALPALLAPPAELEPDAAIAWQFMLVAIGASAPTRAPWLDALALADPDVANMCAAIDEGCSLLELAGFA